MSQPAIGMWAVGVGSLDCASAVYSAGYVTSLPATAVELADADGVQQVVVCVKDRAGNLGSGSAHVTLDREAPTGTVAINDGASLTSSTAVTLEIVASSDTTGMHVGNVAPVGGDCGSVVLGAFVSTMPWGLDGTAGDGEHTVYVCLGDSAGNRALLTASIILTRAAPNVAGAVVRVVGEADGIPSETVTRVTSVMVEVAGIAAAVAGGHEIPVTQMRVWNASSAEPTFWAAYQPSLPWLLGSGDGTKTVNVRVRDAAGNVAEPVAGSIILDTTPPTGAVVIGGAGFVSGYTSSREIVAAITYGADAALFAWAQGTLDCNAEATPYVAVSGTGETVYPSLTGPGGEKTIVVCLKDLAGNTFQAFDSVVLDTAPPKSTIQLAGGAAFTNTAVIPLAIAAPEDAAHMSIHTSGVAPDCASASYVPFEANRTITLPVGDGVKTVHVCVRDHAHNTHLASASITLDTTPPTIALALNGGSSHAKDPVITAQLSVSADVVQMAYSLSGVINCATAVYEPYAVTRSITLPSVEDTYQVHACARDAAGNTSSDSAQIILDMTPPQVTVTVAGGAARINTRQTSFTATMTEETRWAVGVGSLDCASAVYSAGYVTSLPATAVELADADGVQQVVVCVRDRAGNLGSGIGAVELDTSPPTVMIPGGFSILEARHVAGSLWVNDRSVTLQLGAAGATNVRYAENELCTAADEPYSETKPFVVTPGDGLKTLSVQYLDDVGNSTECFTLDLRLDTFIASPAVSLVGHDGYSGTTSSQAVTVTLTGVDVTDAFEMRVSNLASFIGSAWGPVQTSFDWALASGDGTKDVFVRLRDKAGNTIDGAGSIVLKQSPPSAPALQIIDVDGDGFALSATSIELMWSLPAGTVEVELQRFVSSQDYDYVRRPNELLAAPQNAFVDTVTQPGYLHSYRIRGFDAVGNASVWSAVAAAMPFEPIRRVSWLYDVGGIRYDFPAPRGTFDLFSKYTYREPSDVLVSRPLVNNSTQWQRDPYTLVFFEEMLQFRLRNQDSTLVYDVDVGLNIHKREAPDPASSGMEPSLAVDADGVLHIAAYNSTGKNLRYTTNASGSWQSSTRDSSGYAGFTPSLAIDSIGRVHVVYRSSSPASIRYTRKTGGTWTSHVAIAGSCGEPYMVLDSQDNVHVVCWVFEAGANRILHITNATGIWVVDAVEVHATHQFYRPKIVIDEDDHLHVAYWDLNSTYLRYARKSTGAWETANIHAVANSGHPIAMTLGQDGPLIFYRHPTADELQYAEFSNGVWEIRPLPLTAGMGASMPAVTTDFRGNVHLSFLDGVAQNLMYLTNSYGSWQLSVADARPSAGTSSSIAVDAVGRVHIAYFDGSAATMGYVMLKPDPRPVLFDERFDAASASSVAVGPDAAVHVAYGGTVDQGLKIATRRAGWWSIVEADTSGNVGHNPSIQVDGNGSIHVSHYDGGPKTLRYTTNASGAWASVVVDSYGGYFTSLALDSLGFVHIAYHDSTNYDLEYATNASGVWVVETIDHDGTVGLSPSIAIDQDDSVHISYVHTGNGPLDPPNVRYATNRSGTWVWMNIAEGTSPSLAIDDDGYVHIGYSQDGSLMYASDRSGSWMTFVIDPSVNAGAAAIVIDARGEPHISYSAQTVYIYGDNYLKYATRASGRWVIATLVKENGIKLGILSSLALDADGNSHISYWNQTERRLWYITDIQGAHEAADVRLSTSF